MVYSYPDAGQLKDLHENVLYDVNETNTSLSRGDVTSITFNIGY